MAKIKVLIVDDSALIRALLREIIDAQPDMCTVGAAADPYVARDLIKSLEPDVITLDVEMPRMNGLDFLERLMRLRPMPVLMISSLTAAGSEATFRALELGAVDFVAKPALGIQAGLSALADELSDKIRTAAAARVTRLAPLVVDEKRNADAVLPRRSTHLTSTEKLIFIGASTGGTEAIARVIELLPPDAPGVCITQHMPPLFTKSYAARLDGLCKIHVKEAEDGERILPGHAYLAPGDRHLLVARRGANYVVELSDGPPVSRHRPSVDVLFRSAANVAGKNAIAAILTGMGDDGAAGMREMHQAGAYTIAQDEATCVVYGMPKAAVATGGVDTIVPLTAVARTIMTSLDAMGMRAIRV
ncbi:MAG: chemotaxis response regulator protein-glutamate methylesterase [Candidatus Velthaea sp.]|jgi:two-component system chemotaxis response regulator CheB